jgi:ribosome-interacting GTPase 1
MRILEEIPRIIENSLCSGTGEAGFEVAKTGDARVGFVGFPSVSDCSRTLKVFYNSRQI